MNIIPEIGHFKVACDTVSVVSNCIMGLYLFFSNCSCMGNWDQIRLPKYSHCTVRVSWATCGKIAEKKVHLSDKNITAIQFAIALAVKPAFLKAGFHVIICWTISSYLGEHMDTRRTLHYHFLAGLIYRESKNPNQQKFPNSRL